MINPLTGVESANILSVEEAANRIQSDTKQPTTTKDVMRLCERNKLPGAYMEVLLIEGQVQKVWRIPEAAIDNWIKQKLSVDGGAQLPNRPFWSTVLKIGAIVAIPAAIIGALNDGLGVLDKFKTTPAPIALHTPTSIDHGITSQTPVLVDGTSKPDRWINGINFPVSPDTTTIRLISISKGDQLLNSLHDINPILEVLNQSGNAIVSIKFKRFNSHTKGSKRISLRYEDSGSDPGNIILEPMDVLNEFKTKTPDDIYTEAILLRTSHTLFVQFYTDNFIRIHVNEMPNFGTTNHTDQYVSLYVSYSHGSKKFEGIIKP